MENLIEDLTRGNPTEVKVVLASIVAALACYQVVLMAIGYGKVRIPPVRERAASFAHRAIGDALIPIVLVVSVMCLSYFELEGDTAVHIAAASLLLVALALKVTVVRWAPGLGRFLPALGISIWVLIAITFATSAGDFLVDR